MAWRVAKSLNVLLDEINSIAPNRSKRSDGSIGDTAHKGSASDHNPNRKQVVCARDFTHDPRNGADMDRISRTIAENGHPALKYIIFNRRIYFPGRGWQRYYGSNPHSHHMHVSVGRGNDGQSDGPYDNTSPWGVDDDMPSTEEIYNAVWRRDQMDSPAGFLADNPMNKHVMPESVLRATHNRTGNILDRQARMEAKITALTAAVEALAGSVGADPEDIKRAVEDGVNAALKDIAVTLTVDSGE